MKKLFATLMTVAMLASMSTAAFADNPQPISNNISVSNVETRSFSRSFSAEIDAEEWTNVGWDINVYNDKRLEIQLDESNGTTVAFKILEGNLSPRTVKLTEGQSKVVRLINGDEFSIFAQIDGEISETATISGYFNLAKK